MIRYHSFYPGHRERAYEYLMNDRDRRMFEWVRAFNPYDLYSKSAERPDAQSAAAVLRRADRGVFSGASELVRHCRSANAWRLPGWPSAAPWRQSRSRPG